jgi:hypothetical protein
MTHIITQKTQLCEDFNYSQMYTFVLTMITNFEPFFIVKDIQNQN